MRWDYDLSLKYAFIIKYEVLLLHKPNHWSKPKVSVWLKCNLKLRSTQYSFPRHQMNSLLASLVDFYLFRSLIFTTPEFSKYMYLKFLSLWSLAVYCMRKDLSQQQWKFQHLLLKSLQVILLPLLPVHFINFAVVENITRSYSRNKFTLHIHQL